MAALGFGLVAVAIACALCACGGGGGDDSPKKPEPDASPDTGVGGDAGSAVCGNGVVEVGEACDEGAKNGAGSGCTNSCEPECSDSSECDDGAACNGAETCEAAGSGQACKPGTPPSDGTSCESGGYCKDGACTKPVCGNAEVEPGEACEPPNDGGCSATCQICGDGVIGTGEDCDDGGLKNLDGCDSTCRYETVMRFSHFEYTTATGPAFCVHPANAFGTALASEIAGALSQGLNSATSGGLNNMILGFDGLADLTGQNAASVKVAMMNGTIDPRFTWKPGSIDAWFVATPSTVDAAGKPTGWFGPGSIQNGVLSLAAGDFPVQSVFNITPYDLYARDTTVRATIASTPAPDVPAAPPSKLAPGLTVFQSLSAMADDEGLCAALTVGSLATGNIPQDFALGQYACSANCSDSHAYTYCGPGQPVGPNCNSWLDILVGGCKVSSLCIPAIKPVQPDVGTGSSPPVPIVLGPNNKSIVTSPNDAFSIWLKFEATRAHFTNNLP